MPFRLSADLLGTPKGAFPTSPIVRRPRTGQQVAPSPDCPALGSRREDVVRSESTAMVDGRDRQPVILSLERRGGNRHLAGSRGAWLQPDHGVVQPGDHTGQASRIERVHLDFQPQIAFDFFRPASRRLGASEHDLRRGTSCVAVLLRRQGVGAENERHWTPWLKNPPGRWARNKTRCYNKHDHEPGLCSGSP